WLWRLDEHWENPGRFEDPTVTERPSEYFVRQGFVSIECDEEPARHAVDGRTGACFVFSTDYPHYDTKYPEATAHFLKLPLAEEHKRRILWDNCARLYGF
ncbi:MAG: BarH protein, partial [Candidatus Rokuibacteriota bacterium]